LEAYYALPIEKNLNFAVDNKVLDPKFLKLDPLVFETCRWQLPYEAYRVGYSITTYSAYLGLIQ
jgi:hypothetical protein